MIELEGKLDEVGSAQAKASKELDALREELAEVRQKERAWHEQCQQLQDKVKVLTDEKEALRVQHLSEVRGWMHEEGRGWMHKEGRGPLGGEGLGEPQLLPFLVRRLA